MNAWKKIIQTREIRNKLLYTLGLLFLTRIGTQIPAPGVNLTYIQESLKGAYGSAVDFIDLFTGGSFSQMSVFALGITPYITASIIIQLLTIVFPTLEELQKDGASGQKKMDYIMRCVAAGISLMEAVALGVGLGRRGLLNSYTVHNIVIFTAALIAGALLLLWMGERITAKGIGNGISLILLINILSRLPQDVSHLYEMFVKGKKAAPALLAAVIIIIIILITVLLVLILQGGEQKIRIQYAQQVRSRKAAGRQDSYIPLKVNTAGVIPVIFASSVMQMPIMIASFLDVGNSTGIGTKLLQALNSNNWCNPQKPWASLGLLLYIGLTVFFAYFYTSITFSPEEIADRIRKNGGVLPGIRPGRTTAAYIKGKLIYMIFIGSCGLVIIQVIPFIFNGVYGASISFGGTSLIIITGVVIETMRQIESQLLERRYKKKAGFMAYR